MKAERTEAARAEPLEEGAITFSLEAIALFMKFAPEMQQCIAAQLIGNMQAQNAAGMRVILTRDVAQAAIAASSEYRRLSIAGSNGVNGNGSPALKLDGPPKKRKHQQR